jgi:hypothetical protein
LEECPDTREEMNMTRSTLVVAVGLVLVACSNGGGGSSGLAIIELTSIAFQAEEGAGTIVATVSRSGRKSSAVSIDYATSDGTAVAGIDYTAASGTLSWVAGDVADKTITVTVADEVDIEVDETLILTLSNPSPGAALGQSNPATLTILNDDTTLQFDMPTHSVAELGGNATITVTRLGTTQGTVGISYATSDGTATAGTDYTSASGTVSWSASDTTVRTFAVPILPDTQVEGDETVDITLSNPTGGAAIGGVGAAVLTILDDDYSLEFTVAAVQIPEGAGPASISVSRTGGASGAVSVDYAVAGGTATSGVDYTAPVGGTLSWADQDTADKVITIDILDEADIETDETIDLALSNPAPIGAVLGAQSTATITILNDDTTVQFDSATYSIDESGGSATVTVTRLGATSTPVSVDYATIDATATAGSDYTSASGTFNWAGSDTTGRTFPVPVTNDNLAEGDETVSLSLSNPQGGAIVGTPGTAVLTIADDDINLEFTTASYMVVETGLFMTISVARRGSATGAVSVDYATSDGSAQDAQDYTGLSGTLDWVDQDMADKTFDVAILDDALSEGDETVNLTLSNPVGATLGPLSTAVLTIDDDECTGGALDPAFGTGGSITSGQGGGASNGAYAIAIDTTWMYVPGTLGGTWQIEKRSLFDGVLDPNFGTAGAVIEDPSGVDDIPRALAMDGLYMYVVGQEGVTSLDQQWRMEKRLLSDGSLDLLFGNNGVVTTNPTANIDRAAAVAVDSGHMYIAGREEGPDQWRIEKRSLVDGTLDPLFGTGGVIRNSGRRATGIVLDATSLYVVGTDTEPGNLQWRIEKRSLVDGSPDVLFGGSGMIAENPSPDEDEAIQVALDGSSLYVVGHDHVVSGADGQWRIEKRDLVDGLLDPAFGIGGVETSNPGAGHDVAHAVAVDGGTLYVVGSGIDQWRLEIRDAATGFLLGTQPSDPFPAAADETWGVAVTRSAIFAVGSADTFTRWHLEKRCR